MAPKDPRKPPHEPFNPGRRRFIAGMAATGALALTGCSSNGGDDSAGTTAGDLPPLPDPKDSGIDHIVVVMMENRSFDHYLGWVPGANGRQAGLQFPDKSGQMQSTFRLSQHPDYGFQGCNHADPDHSYKGGRVELNGGAMDGWLKTDGTNGGDLFPIGYYTQDDLPFTKAAVENWTICDRYFCSILSQTFPNRFYMHAGQTDRNDNALRLSSLPTIWDRLNAKGRTSRFYYSDLPFIGLFGANHVPISGQIAEFLVDAATGMLPDVAYIDPNFGGSIGESPTGVSQDDHPQADVRNGQVFLNTIYDALRNSPQWDKTLLIINYDEWGGFYDHVVPPFAPVTPEEFTAIGNDGRLGFRVPCYLMGPRARKAHVSSVQFDHNSILNFICWRIGLDTLGARGDTSLNIAHALDFSSAPRTDTPAFSDVPAGVDGLGTFGAPCLALPVKSLALAADGYARHQNEWAGLREVVKNLGYQVR